VDLISLVTDRRRSLGVGLLVAAVVVSVAAVGFAAVRGFAMNRHSTVFVVPVSSDDPGFLLDVPHSRVEASGDAYRFDPSIDGADVLELAIQAYPDAVVDGSSLSIVIDGVRYNLAPEDDGTWLAERKTVTVASDSLMTSIAFPVDALPGQLLRIGEPTEIIGDPARVREELTLLGATTDEAGRVIVPSSSGSSVFLLFAGAEVTASMG
jgi:hypothetical protein